ncbi:rhamnan synthesis F family protein [Gemmiger sp.]
MKRLVIYFHYDPAGCIDTACRIAVQAMQKYGKVVFVTNGTLAPADRVWVRQSGAGRIERKNVGFDVGAYKEALLTLGREELAKYDEVILMNYTLAGPVCPLAPMFAAMDARADLDFWGLTRHYAMKSRRFGGNVPEHLQSHFLALRPRLFTSDDFWRYWQEMELPASYEQSVIRHETRFTPYFAAKGYTWDSYVNTDDVKAVFVNPIMACPKELLQNRGCPFFKRRSLFTPYADELRRTDGMAARELCGYVLEQTDFPLDLLLVSLLKTQPLAALAKNLHWRYIVDGPTGETVDLAARGLRLIRYDLPETDSVTAWYNAQAAVQADTLLTQAAALFEKEPLLGMLSPSLPLYAGCAAARRRAWLTEKDTLQKEAAVPIDDTPLPAPNCGWVLVRESAFPQGIPDCKTQRDAWKLALTAQANGAYAACFETAAQSAARADILAEYESAAAEPAAVAKQFGRLIKHKLQK